MYERTLRSIVLVFVALLVTITTTLYEAVGL
jgi:hypothetical protein